MHSGPSYFAELTIVQVCVPLGTSFERSGGTPFPIRLQSRSLGAQPSTLLGGCAYLAAYLAARRELRVHVRVRSPGTDGSDDRGKITSLELLACRGSGDDVRRRDHSRHGALLRALRSKTRRIRTSRRLAQKNNDAAGY